MVTTAVHIGRATGKRTLGDWVALGLATCGVGYLPLAPGTWGSAVGVGLYLMFDAASVRLIADGAARGLNAAALTSLRTSGLLLIVVALTLAGIWAATRAEGLLGRKDPGAVVIDEVAGQFLTFLFVPYDTAKWMVVIGFIAFRAFDIWKPYPIRRLEALESGLGIMADDILAGAYAATLVSVLMTIQLWIV